MEIIKGGAAHEQLKKELNNPDCAQWIKDWLDEIENEQ